MSIEFDALGARLMLRFLRSVAVAGWDEETLVEALATEGYRKYLKYHSDPSWPDPFGEAKFRAMLQSIAEHTDGGLGPRLSKVRFQYATASAEIPHYRQLVGLFETANYEPTIDMVRSLLPSGTRIDTVVYLLMDGFNNGTAFEKTILVDVLSMSADAWREFLVVIGHELHHVGFDYCLSHNKRYAKAVNRLTQPARAATRLLESLLGEGVADRHFGLSGEALERYLRGTKSWDEARDVAGRWEEMRAEGSQKLPEVFELMLDLLEATEISGSHLARHRALSTDQPVPWVNVAGEAMIRAIEQAHGPEATLTVISEPWKFLRLYESARITSGEPPVPAELLQIIDRIFAL